MASDINPWSAETWDPIAQSNYIRKYGMARAIARAKDAGTTVHGAPPAPKYNHAKHAKAVLAIVKRRNAQRGTPVTVFPLPAIQMDLGITDQMTAESISTEVDIILSPGDITFGAAFRLGANVNDIPFGLVQPIFPGRFALGFDEAAAVDAVIAPGAFNLGISEAAPAFDLTRVFSASIGLGISERSTVGNERQLVASMGLGISANNDIEINAVGVSANPNLGLTESATISFEKDFAAALALGLTESATISFEKDFAASFNLGADQTVELTDAEQDLTLSFDLGFAADAALGTVKNIVASMDLGVAQAAAADVLANLITNATLGVSEAAAVQRESDLTANVVLGVSEAANPSATIPAIAVALGVDEAAATALEAELAASMALGASMGNPAWTLETELTAAMNLGIAQTQFVQVEHDSVQDMHLGFDMNVTPTLPFQLPAISEDLGVSAAATFSNEQRLTVAMGLGISGPAASIPTVNPLTIEQGLFANPVINNSTFAAAASVTYNSVDFGTAASNRWIVAVVYHGNVAATVTGVTIGGVNAINMGGDGGGVRRASVWVANIAAGSSGSIAINFSANQTGCLCASYVVHGDIDTSGTEAFFESFANVSSISSQSLSVKSGGLTLGILAANNVGAAWANGSPSQNTDYGPAQPFTASELVWVRSLDGLNFAADGSYTTGAATTLTSSSAPYEAAWSIRPDPNPPAKLNVSPALGISEAAAITTTPVTLVAASPSLGITESAIISGEADIIASMALGVSEAATVQAQSPALTVAFLQETTITQTSASFSFTGQNLGTAAADRWIVCMTAFRVSSRTVSTMTIGGVTATKIAGGTQVGTNKVELWAAQVPSGASGTVAITMSGTGQSGSIMLYEVHGNLNTTAVDSREFGNTNAVATQTLTVNSGGFVIGCVLANNVNFAWAQGVPAWNVDTTTSLSGGEIRHARHGNIESANGTHTTGAVTNAGTTSYYLMVSLAPV